MRLQLGTVARRFTFFLNVIKELPKNLATKKSIFDLLKIHIPRNNLTVKKNFGMPDVSRKYRIKQNNDYPSNKPSFMPFPKLQPNPFINVFRPV